MKALSFNAKPLQGRRLLLAHSGGVDSSVLAHLLLEANLDFSVAHCNFQLRGAESDQDASFVKNWCQQHQIPFFEIAFSTEAYQEHSKKSTQLAARDLRYKWFESLQFCHNFEILLTGHHLNDQIETFLIHASRGTGISGLLGIPQTSNLVRPLLGVSKEKIISYAQSHSLVWREDRTNLEPTYLRNRIRNEVLAPLEKINARVAKTKKAVRAPMGLTRNNNITIDETIDISENMMTVEVNIVVKVPTSEVKFRIRSADFLYK